jgi:DNA-binding transcriptional regulator GbsR (MarR family)
VHPDEKRKIFRLVLLFSKKEIIGGVRLQSNVLDKFSAHFSRLGKQLGLGASAGRVYGILFFSDTQLTQKEIARRSRYSLGLVSKDLKTLRESKMVRQIRTKRQMYYIPIVSLSASFERLLTNLNDKEIQPIVSMLLKYRMDLQEGQLKEKIDSLLQDYQRVNNLIENALSS